MITAGDTDVLNDIHQWNICKGRWLDSMNPLGTSSKMLFEKGQEKMTIGPIWPNILFCSLFEDSELYVRRLTVVNVQ